MTKHNSEEKLLQGLIVEHEKLLSKIKKWRSETVMYRWLNILMFMASKLIVPIGALIVALNMVAIVFGTQFLSSKLSAWIAIVVTCFASIEAMFNPGAKKRIAFNLHNELDSLENKMNLVLTTNDPDEIRKVLVQTDDDMKRLLNSYSENGY